MMSGKTDGLKYRRVKDRWDGVGQFRCLKLKNENKGYEIDVDSCMF